MKPYYEDSHVQIFHGDCREILPSIGQVDLVLTDPPYLQPDLEWYSRLSTWGNTILPLGAFLYAYAPTLFLPDVIRRLTEKLAWFWLYNIRHNGGWPSLWKTRTLANSKPILAVTNGRPLHLAWSTTDYTTERKSKERHKWGQDTGFAIEHIALRTDEGALVCDPFAGSGTVLMAAKMIGRKCIGIEIEEKSCEIAANRCRQMVLEF